LDTPIGHFGGREIFEQDRTMRADGSKDIGMFHGNLKSAIAAIDTPLMPRVFREAFT